MAEFEFLMRAVLDTLTLFALLVGLAGLLIPIFPGLTVMWLATLAYAVILSLADKMSVFGWVLFGLITILMVMGNIVDNIIIAKSVREKEVPWKSILLGFLAGIVASLFFTPLAGIVAAPLGLYGAEFMRLRDQKKAIASTKAWMTGWGWAILIRIGIGVVMTGLWMVWAWA